MRTYQKYFSAAVKQKYPHNSDFLLSEVSRNFENISAHTTLAKKSANPVDHRLDFCAYFLAMIKTLDEQNESFEEIRQICLQVVLEYVRPKNWFEKVIKQIPAKLVTTRTGRYFLKKFGERVSKKTFEGGFRAQILTDKNETLGFGYGIDILECGICKLFAKYNYNKYAAILCEVDQITSELAGLQLIRTSTIALGATKCDFRYKKIRS